jgi:hypothetical protein
MPCPRIAEVCELFPTVGREEVAPAVESRRVNLPIQPGRSLTICRKKAQKSHAGRRCRVGDRPGSAVCRPGRRTIRHSRAGCASAQCPPLPGAVGNTARCAGNWKRWRSRIRELRGGDPHTRRSNSMAELLLHGGHPRSGHRRPDIALACGWFLHGRGISASGPYSNRRESRG